MNTILAESPALPEGDPPSIVSVNSRGGSSSDLAAKLAFGLLVAGLLVIGGLVGINKYRAAHKLNEQAEAQAAKAASAPAATTKRRTFDTDPPAPAAASAAPSPAFTPTCQDGSAARPLIGPDGQALTAPSGQPMRVCQNGQLMVPAVQALPDDRQLPTGAPQGGLATPPAPIVTTSRYGGDVMLLQSAATLPAAQQVNPMARHDAGLRQSAPSCSGMYCVIFSKCVASARCAAVTSRASAAFAIASCSASTSRGPVSIASEMWR